MRSTLRAGSPTRSRLVAAPGHGGAARRSLLTALAPAVLFTACAGSPGEGARAPATSSSSSASTPGGQRVSGDPIAGTPAYDAAGGEHACALPKPSCPDARPDVEFKDRCQLAGYRVIRCGCDELCTGNVAASSLAYDEKNHGKRCEPEDKSCTPPDTSAAFQDACSESGHRFVVCGCQWLCSGKLKNPVSSSGTE